MRTLGLLSAGVWLCGLALAPPATAQNADTHGIYRLEFALHEVEGGKRVSSRNYVMLVEAGGRGYSRAGTKVPVASGGSGANAVQFVDVGLNLDCRVIERTSGLFLDTSVEMSELATDVKTPPTMPYIRSIRMGAVSVVDTGKNTLLSSVDDASGKRRYELEVNAVKVK